MHHGQEFVLVVPVFNHSSSNCTWEMVEARFRPASHAHPLNETGQQGALRDSWKLYASDRTCLQHSCGPSTNTAKLRQYPLTPDTLVCPRRTSAGICYFVSWLARIMDSSSSPLWMVARPRAAPIPRPRMALGPTRLNLRSEHGVKGGEQEVEKSLDRSSHTGLVKIGLWALTWVRWRVGLER